MRARKVRTTCIIGFDLLRWQFDGTDFEVSGRGGTHVFYQQFYAKLIYKQAILYFLEFR